MPEPIFTEDIFEPEEAKEETMEDLISQTPEPMRPLLKFLDYKYKQPGMIGIMPLYSQLPIEYNVNHFYIENIESNRSIEEMLNNGWRIEMVEKHKATLLIIFSRIKKEEESKNA
jgi:hypothetical protein